jgi:hypothetical protein
VLQGNSDTPFFDDGNTMAEVSNFLKTGSKVLGNIVSTNGYIKG